MQRVCSCGVLGALRPGGWQIVQANYRRYHWQKNIDKLDEEQKQQLAGLIRAAKSGR
jgi:hypothetical protein